MNNEAKSRIEQGMNCLRRETGDIIFTCLAFHHFTVASTSDESWAKPLVYLARIHLQMGTIKDAKKLLKSTLSLKQSARNRPYIKLAKELLDVSMCKSATERSDLLHDLNIDVRLDDLHAKD